MREKMEHDNSNAGDLSKNNRILNSKIEELET